MFFALVVVRLARFMDVELSDEQYYDIMILLCKINEKISEVENIWEGRTGQSYQTKYYT